MRKDKAANLSADVVNEYLLGIARRRLLAIELVVGRPLLSCPLGNSLLGTSLGSRPLTIVVVDLPYFLRQEHWAVGVLEPHQ